MTTVVMATPRYNHNPPPAYPTIARKRGYEGTVLLDVFVKTDGRVGKLRIAASSNYITLDRSAMKAVQRWQFEPGRKADEVVAMWVRVPVAFRLQ
jgi:protein TonB